jgi:hypothetical protein
LAEAVGKAAEGCPEILQGCIQNIGIRYEKIQRDKSVIALVSISQGRQGVIPGLPFFYSSLFIKTADTLFPRTKNTKDPKQFFLLSAVFPFGRADLTASAALQPIRSSLLQLHESLPCRFSNLGS